MKELDVRLRGVALALMIELDSPMASNVVDLIEAGDWRAIASLRCDPRVYPDTPTGEELFRRDYQAVEFLRKSPLLPIGGLNLDKMARETFQDCEQACASTNYLLETIDLKTSIVGSDLRRSLDDPFLDRLVSVLDTARKICTRVLGKVPDDLNGRFGPGTCFELKGSPFTTVLDKLNVVPTATPACRPVFDWLYWGSHWGRTRLVEGLPLPASQRGNRFTTVAKEATKKRGICIEPLGNLFVQLGLGGDLKRRLGRVGLHVGRNSPGADPLQRLRRGQPLDGQAHHQRMAHDGSVTGEWATIDLSNASDTIAYYLVKWLIPSAWFELFSMSRSPYTLLGKTWVRLEKFSSMGNGFTFELESLIFSSLAAAVSGLKVGVDCFAYGDDIIVPGHAARDVVAIMKACGFTPNDRKTFIDGPFRESCGGDFFAGTNVRPCYADSEFCSPGDWMVLHNQLKARGFTAAAKACVQHIPKHFRVWGPPRLGDIVLHGQYTSRPGKVTVVQYAPHGEEGPAHRYKVTTGYQVVTTLVPIPLEYDWDRWDCRLKLTAVLMGKVRSNSRLETLVGVKAPPVGYRLGTSSVS